MKGFLNSKVDLSEWLWNKVLLHNLCSVAVG